MGSYTPDPGGRIARSTNDRIREDLSRADQHLDQFEKALGSLLGELDPIKVQRVIRVALAELRAARPLIRSANTSSWQLNGYFEESARRGPYNKRNGDDD